MTKEQVRRRLTVSGATWVQDERSNGLRIGRRYAEAYASFGELNSLRLHVERGRLVALTKDPCEFMEAMFGYDEDAEEDYEEWLKNQFGTIYPSSEVLDGFIIAALDVLDEAANAEAVKAAAVKTA